MALQSAVRFHVLRVKCFVEKYYAFVENKHGWKEIFLLFAYFDPDKKNSCKSRDSSSSIKSYPRTSDAARLKGEVENLIMLISWLIVN